MFSPNKGQFLKELPFENELTQNIFCSINDCSDTLYIMLFHKSPEGIFITGIATSRLQTCAIVDLHIKDDY